MTTIQSIMAVQLALSSSYLAFRLISSIVDGWGANAYDLFFLSIVFSSMSVLYISFTI